MVELTCQECGGTYEKPECRADSSKYCSRECYNNSQRSRVEKECKWCGEIFEVQSWREDTAKYCSMECRGSWQQENYRGEKHHNYENGGAMLYGGTIAKTEWLRLADKVRERDNRECVECGMTSEEHWENHGQSLAVHHITKPQDCAESENPHDMENLETLCASCHQSEHTVKGEKGTVK